MQRLVPFVVALALVLGGTHLALACSSFAVYGKNGPFFGMNVDMPTRAEAAESAVGFFEHQHNRLALNRRSDVAVFRYDYIFFYTDRGVFGCTQYAQPTFTMNPSDKKPVDWSHAQVSAIDFERAADVVVFWKSAGCGPTGKPISTGCSRIRRAMRLLSNREPMTTTFCPGRAASRL